MSTFIWEKIFSLAEFGDKRLNYRAAQIAPAIENSEGRSLSSALLNRAALKGAIRFMNNTSITPDKLLNGFMQENFTYIQSEHVLLVEDSSEINFSWRKKKLEGLGPVGNGIDQGYFLHPGLIIDPNKKTVLGLASAHFWARNNEENSCRVKEKKKQEYKKKAITSKESYRWIKVPMDVRRELPEKIKMTIVADREADIFDLFHEHQAGKLGTNTEILIRACRDRKIEMGKTFLFKAISMWKVRGEYNLSVGSNSKRKARTATMEVLQGSIRRLWKGLCSSLPPANCFVNVSKTMANLFSL